MEMLYLIDEKSYENVKSMHDEVNAICDDLMWLVYWFGV